MRNLEFETNLCKDLSTKYLPKINVCLQNWELT